jgi:hypothetical protein
MKAILKETFRLRSFLKELSALTRKHGVQVSGCGCCNSPWLNLLGEGDVGLDGRYDYDYEGDGPLRWMVRTEA